MPLPGGGQPFREQLIRCRKTRHQPHQPSIGSEIGNACAHGCGSAIGRTILGAKNHGPALTTPRAGAARRQNLWGGLAVEQRLEPVFGERIGLEGRRQRFDHARGKPTGRPAAFEHLESGDGKHPVAEAGVGPKIGRLCRDREEDLLDDVVGGHEIASEREHERPQLRLIADEELLHQHGGLARQSGWLRRLAAIG